MYVIVAIATLYAERHPVCRGVGGTGDPHNFAITHVQIEVTTHATVGAGRPHFVHLANAPHPQTHLIVQRANGAVSHALTTAFAASVQQGLVGAGHQFGLKAAIGKAPHVAVLDFAASADAATAQNTFFAVNENEGIGIRVNFISMALAVVFGPGHVIVIDPILQLAVAVHFTGHAVVGVVGEQHLQHKLARFAGFLAFGVHHHALKHGRGTGRLQPPRFFHGNHAHPARTHVSQVRMVAQGRNGDTSVSSRF